MKISKYIQIQFLCIMLGIKIYYLIKQIYFYYILTRSKFMNKNKEGQKGKNKPRYAPKQPSDTYRHNYNRQENYQKKKYPIDDQIYRQQRKEPVHVRKKYVQKSSLKEDAANSSKVVQKEENHFAYKQNYQKYQSKQQYKPVENNYLVRNQKSYVQQAQKFKEREQETKKSYNNPKPQYRKIQKEDNKKKHIKAQQYKAFPQSKKVYRQREPDERQVYSKAQTNYRAQIKEEQKNVEKERQFNQQKKYENQQIENQQKSNKESIIDKEAEQDEIYTIPKREKMRDNYLQQNKRKEYSKNPKHHEDFQQQHNKIELQLIGLEDKCKKIKKLLLSDLPNITQLKIYASKLQPTLYFEYFEPNNKQKKIKKHFTQILRDSQKLKQKRSLFQQVFERAFLKLDKKYYNVSVFLIEIAKIRDIKITKRSIFNLDQGHDVMFYYMKGKQNTINFVVFDCFMRSIRASCKDIEDLSRKHPDEYKIYLNFKKKIFEQEQQGQVVDLLDNQQAQSDEDSRPNFQERSIQELKTQLYRIIDKNIEDIQNNIQQLNNQLLKEALNDTNSEKYKILEERIDDLQSGFDMFINTRNTFLDQLAQNVNSKEFHKKYLKKMIIAEKQLESGLPIIGKKRIILQMLKKKNLLVIEGETGSGKSTQLPQILCEFYELFDNPNAKPVLVTQPRRLATRSLAQRVAKQIGEVVGGFVDYVASAGKKVSNDAKIIFKLDRIVLDQLTQDPVLSKYSCLVIDEAHQRTISIDVILGLIKKLLEQRKDFKIIVTSASMDIKLFQNYFKTKTLKVSGRMYPVTIIHKDFKNFYEGDKYQNVRKIEKVINEEILSPSGDSMKSEYKGHLLCFCSQIDEINKLVQIYEKKLNKRMFEVFALHGKITSGQQKKVFEELGKHKIIFANRIAETAITIDGVKVVIDPGNDVQLVYDQKFKYSSMKMQEITKSSAKQRAGRAGRTAPGYCFRLYSQTNFNARPINKVPQIQNSSLQTVVLRLKTLRIRDVINFEYISPPNKEGLQTSLKLLTLIGALKPITQEVTKIGNLIIKIPIDPFLSRAIVESLMFQKFLKAYNSKRYINLPQKQRVLLQTRGLANTIISILSLVINFSNLFYVKKQERQEGEKMKYYEFSDQEGDFFFLENIYQKFIKLKQKGQNKLRQDNNYKNRQLSTWIRDSYLNFKAMNQTEDLIKEISTIISDFDLNLGQYEDEIDKIKSKLKQCKTFREVILSCLITSFSANICKYSKNSHIGYTMVSQRKPLLIYGTSNLNLLGKQPQWIVCYDLYTNETGRLYCKLAHQVSYQFMKTHLDTFVWQLFDIQGIQKKSPFYKEQILQFPTLFINKFKKDYNQSQKNERFAFLKDSYPEIVEQKGRITFFLQLGTSQKINKKIQNEFDEALQKYQVSVINQSMNQYRHNYIGNVYVTLYDGFKIQKIEFDNREFLLETTGPTDIIQQMAVDCQCYGPFSIQQTDKNRDLRKRQGTGLVTYQDKRKLKLTIFSLAQKDQFEKYFLIMRSHGHHLQLKQTIIDKRRKIPKTKIYMYFFAGTSQEKKLYAHYEFGNNDIYSARNMVEFIKEGITKAKMQNSFNPKLNTRDVQATKKGNGINIYTSCDEYEIAQDLFKMDKAGLLDTFFKMPLFIKKFREPEINEASKTNEQWKTQLYTLFEKSKIKTQNITINIRGIYRPDKSKGPLSEFQKTFRVDMTAQIITLDSNVLQRLKNNYDGKVKVIGCQKVHVRAKYDQLLATASYKAFESLQDQYELQVQRFKHQFPLLIIEVIVRLIRGHQKVMIYAHSPNREDFVKPLRIISSMFTPKLVKLTEAQFRFLDKIKEGSQILDQIQIKYNYKIYFGFDKWTTTLKVYCHDNEIKDIENNIKEQIAKYKYFCEKISYRGKNLNKVKQILDNYLNNNANPLMTYEIKFQFREVLVTGDLDTVEFIKNQILKLVNSGKEECIICADIMKTPYKLICGCSFCCMCLTEHIRAYRNSSGTELFRCPKDDCKSGINIYDVKNLLSEQQFNKMCDVRINKYLQANKQKYIACNYCENVFDREQVEAAGEINCQICGKSECLKCKSSHPNYTCEEWKQRDTLNLQKLGIKKCPQCSTGITKNGGCNHMECRNCKAHICWKCLKFFGTSKECYDHLAKYCGGIFDPNDIY